MIWDTLYIIKQTKSYYIFRLIKCPSSDNIQCTVLYQSSPRPKFQAMFDPRPARTAWMYEQGHK